MYNVPHLYVDIAVPSKKKRRDINKILNYLIKHYSKTINVQNVDQINSIKFTTGINEG